MSSMPSNNNQPWSIKLGNWLMDTRFPIPFHYWLGDKIKYNLTPEEYWDYEL